MDEREHEHEHDWLAQRFEAERPHLRAVAHRLLGSPGEADDAVQEAWLRLSRADTTGIANLGGWLTTVVSHVCLDLLRARTARREEPLDVHTPEPPVSPTSSGDSVSDPADQALLAESVGLALLVVLDTLSPAERLAFVLHDLFDVPFDEIAPIVGRSPTAARQLASRARRRVQGRGQQQDATPLPDADRTRQRKIVDAFLAAARAGDFEALLSALDPEVVLRADPAAVAVGASREVRGAPDVAQQFAGRARVAKSALIDGAAGAVWAPGGQPRVIFTFTIVGGKITAIDILADPERLRHLDLTILDAGG